MKNSELKYFTRLELENIKCFGTKQPLDLSDGNGNPTRWNLILGNNGVGKTTLLDFLAWMRPEPANDDAELIKREDNENGISYIRLDPITKLPKAEEHQEVDEKKEREIIILVPALQNVDDNSFFEKLPKSTQSSLWLHAHLSQGKRLVDIQSQNEDSQLRTKSQNLQDNEIITGIQASYWKDTDKKGELTDLKREGNTVIKNRDEIETNFTPPFIVVYGASRYMGKENKEESKLKDPISNRLTETHELYDVEEILQDLDYARLKFNTKRDNDYFEEVKKMIVRVLQLDSSEDIHINPTKRIKGSPNPDGVSFKTYSGEVGISALSLGYKTTLAWTFDLAWRLYENYSESTKPLDEPAIVLIDELDLHLHPKWQLRIMDDLTNVFPNVQFIATSHSPLLVQSNPSSTNFAVIKKNENEVLIENDPELIKGWRVDQILNSEYFGVKISRPPETEKLFEKRDKLLLRLNRSSQEEKELQNLQQEISMLRTQANPEEDEAIMYLQKAAELLKREESSKK